MIMKNFNKSHNSFYSSTFRYVRKADFEQFRENLFTTKKKK